MWNKVTDSLPAEEELVAIVSNSNGLRSLVPYLAFRHMGQWRLSPSGEPITQYANWFIEYWHPIPAAHFPGVSL